jgi:hypothetical protein
MGLVDARLIEVPSVMKFEMNCTERIQFAFKEMECEIIQGVLRNYLNCGSYRIRVRQTRTEHVTFKRG